MLAYLFPTFPVFHQTFVLWEVMGLRRNGVNMKIYSLRRPSAQQQPEGKELIRNVTYLPSILSAAVLRANWHSIRADVRRYARLYAEIFRAWRTGATVPPSERSGGKVRSLLLYDRMRGWFNTQPLLYLLKSLWLVPGGVYLAEQLGHDGITHVHAHWATYPGTVAYVAHLASGIPFSISAHAYDVYMVRRMLPAKLRAARFTVTCAQANATFLKHLAGGELGDKIMVNYHGVDVGRFAPPRVAKPAGRFTVVSCGQLEQYKGMHLLIDACAQLRQRNIMLECWIIGEGPQRHHLQRQIERLGLVDSVRLLGSRPQAEVVEVLGKADVFVLASEINGTFGRRDVIANVIAEAMAVGLPVVASHIPGVEELVENGTTGFLVPPNRVDELVKAMAALANDADVRKRLGQAGRRRILRDFDSSKNVRVLADLLIRASDHDSERLAGAAS